MGSPSEKEADLQARVERLEQLLAILQGQSGALGLQTPGAARNVINSALPAYTYSNGVITGNAVGAMGAKDGVLNVANDVVFLPGGIAVVASQQGAYVVTNPGSATEAFVLTRVSWMPEGATIKTGYLVRMGGEGTVFQNTVWESMAVAEEFVVGAIDSQFFPQKVEIRAQLVGGQIAGLATVPILSTSSYIGLTRAVFDTGAATVMYAATVGGVEGITPGYLGTAALTVQAVIAAGTINAADVSTLHILITNGQR